MFFSCMAVFGAAFAHEYAIYPVLVDLKINQNRIEAKLESNAGYWYDEILHVPFKTPLPGSDWPEEFEKRARDYVNKSFELKLGEKTLTASSFQCRYIQEPLQPASSKVIYEIIYPIETKDAELARQTLSGRSRFFSEYKAHRDKENVKSSQPEEYVTRLTVSAAKKIHIDVPFENPEFNLPLAGLVRTPFQQKVDGMKNAGIRLVNYPPFLIAVIVGIVFLIRRRKRGSH